MDNDINGKTTESSLAIGFAVAAVWFSTHCGGGFATGNQEVNYFVKYGWYAFFLPAIAMILVGWSHRNGLVIAKDYKTYDYKSYSNALFHPYEKIFTPIIEIGIILTILCAVSCSIAGAGALLEDSIGLNYGVAIVLIGILILILTIFGSDLVIKASKVLVYFLIGALLIFVILGIKLGAPNISQVLAVKNNFDAGFGEAVWKMLIYVGFQSFAVMNIISVAQKVKTTRECNMFGVIGVILNGFFLIAVCIMLLGFTPQILTETLPVYDVCQKIGIPWLSGLYFVTLFVALMGTGLTFVFAAVTRFETVWTKGNGIFESLRSRRIAISLITIVLCVGVSVFGLTNVVVKGYGFTGYIGLFGLVIPQLVVGTIKIRKNARLRKEQGIDEETVAMQ